MFELLNVRLSRNSRDLRWGISLGSTFSASSPSVCITSVERGSMAEKSGLRVGDAIVELFGLPLATHPLTPAEAEHRMEQCNEVAMLLRRAMAPGRHASSLAPSMAEVGDLVAAAEHLLPPSFPKPMAPRHPQQQPVISPSAAQRITGARMDTTPSTTTEIYSAAPQPMVMGEQQHFGGGGRAGGGGALAYGQGPPALDEDLLIQLDRQQQQLQQRRAGDYYPLSAASSQQQQQHTGSYAPPGEPTMPFTSVAQTQVSPVPSDPPRWDELIFSDVLPSQQQLGYSFRGPAELYKRELSEHSTNKYAQSQQGPQAMGGGGERQSAYGMQPSRGLPTRRMAASRGDSMSGGWPHSGSLSPYSSYNTAQTTGEHYYHTNGKGTRDYQLEMLIDSITGNPIGTPSSIHSILHQPSPGEDDSQYSSGPPVRQVPTQPQRAGDYYSLSAVSQQQQQPTGGYAPPGGEPRTETNHEQIPWTTPQNVPQPTSGGFAAKAGEKFDGSVHSAAAPTHLQHSSQGGQGEVEVESMQSRQEPPSSPQKYQSQSTTTLTNASAPPQENTSAHLRYRPLVPPKSTRVVAMGGSSYGQTSRPTAGGVSRGNNIASVTHNATLQKARSPQQPMSRVFYTRHSPRTYRELSPSATIAHLQYNSPLNIYSADSAEEAYHQQTGEELNLKMEDSSGAQYTYAPAYMDSPTRRLIVEQEQQGLGPSHGGGYRSQPQQSASMQRIAHGLGVAM